MNIMIAALRKTGIIGEVFADENEFWRWAIPRGTTTLAFVAIFIATIAQLP